MYIAEKHTKLFLVKCENTYYSCDGYTFYIVDMEGTFIKLYNNDDNYHDRDKTIHKRSVYLRRIPFIPSKYSEDTKNFVTVLNIIQSNIINILKINRSDPSMQILFILF